MKCDVKSEMLKSFSDSLAVFRSFECSCCSVDVILVTTVPSASEYLARVLCCMQLYANNFVARPASTLTACRVQRNIEGLTTVFSQFLTFGEGATDARLVNNDAWLSDLSYLDFLREYGPHFTINRMMAYDSVRLRLEREQPLTFLEFNYMLLQAYDFTELYRRYG